MSSILYEKDFSKLESSIHESTYKLFMHMTLMDMCMDNAMKEFELRKRAMIKARDDMQAAGELLLDEPEDDAVAGHQEEGTLPRSNLSGITMELVLRTIRGLEGGPASTCIAALTCAMLIAPAAAMDDHLVLGRVFSAPDVYEIHQVPTMAIGTLTGMLLLCGGYLMGAARSLVGPLMGITSVLYFMLRNDAAVEAVLAWG
ncbi:uncharacterized protein N0V89_009321 [Didymosphaeria variabile]|uniref:Uncharacterized protein n=1 Tax=Didymosphaeria variabile TaxID=1932322 RepID=A0A9W8XEW7_9PLEO|nr:uncharacterized protein N0V89_009321 [Didymosphaeria variabile]KAJ4347949.1 hypothetical protein N0V89_009321 [Didymosphaeria variabile]